MLDTHSLLWWFNKPHLLSTEARAQIEERRNRVLVSAISGYELALKHRLGKLDAVGPLLDVLVDWIPGEGFQPLEATLEHALAAGRLDLRHRDPFDRFLIAQALVEDVELVSNEKLFDSFGVRRLW